VREELFTTPGLRGLRLRAIHRGDETAPPLVLLHGGGANAHWWDHLTPELSERFHVVALDFRGHGGSDWPEPEVGAFQADLVALLEHLGDPTAILVGHSMGGHVALVHASRRGTPGPRALVAVDVARGADSRARRAMRLALFARRTYRSREDAVARYRFLPRSPRVAEELRRHIAEHSVRSTGDRFGFRFDPRWFALPPAARPDLRTVRAPTLVIRGAESPLLSAERAAGLAAELPDGRAVEIPEAGHNVHLDQPRAFLDALKDFLDDRQS
jgi:pimeloyl-ACP methyl ester carboxylesterase